MKPRHLLLSLSVFLFNMISGQQTIDYNFYHPLKCKGEMPDDFQTLTRDRFEESSKTEAAYNHNKPVSEEESDFLLQSDYSINEMLLSGKVLFGDTITSYINKVADHVLINNPGLRSKLRFYCLRSSEANAFSTRQGIVFVTMGLMAQLENEAQLAFILSHEIAHYEKRHTLLSYHQNQSVFDKNSADRYNSYDEQIRASSNYSKSIELEADSLGLVRLAKTGYDCEESVGSFFVLQFSKMPFEDYPFDAGFMETQYMKFPHSLFLDSLRPINLQTDMDDDDYSTHPNIATRRKKLQLMLDNYQDCGKEKFKETQASFFTVRKIARFETIRILLNERQYAEAIYNCQILQREDPNSNYLKESIGKGLYGIAKYKNHDRYAETAGYFGKKEGNQQQCYHLFSVLKPEQVTLIALRYLYNLSLTDHSTYVNAMCDDLAEEAVEFHEITVEQMKKAFEDYSLAQKNGKPASKDTVVAQKQNTSAQTTDPNAFVSKYDKLRNEKAKQEQADLSDSKFHLLAFADMLNDPALIALFTKAEKNVPVKTTKTDDEDAPEEGLVPYKYISTIEKQKTLMQDTVKGIGTDSVVFIRPFYWITDKHGFVPIQSEAALMVFDSTIKVKANASELNSSYLFPKDFESKDVEKYNDLSVVNDWIDEKTDHGDLMFIPSETNLTSALAQKYHTVYFACVGITDYEKSTGYFLLVYDVTSGKAEYYKKVPYEYSPDKIFISNCLLYSNSKIKTK